jgi:hypothetical protein
MFNRDTRYKRAWQPKLIVVCAEQYKKNHYHLLLPAQLLSGEQEDKEFLVFIGIEEMIGYCLLMSDGFNKGLDSKRNLSS